MWGVWCPRKHGEASLYAVWQPISGTSVVLVGLFAAASLALPTPSEYATGPLAAGDVFRPEWLIAATLLVVPLYHAARRSWQIGLIFGIIAVLQVLYITSAGVHALHSAGLRSGAYSLWYVVAVVQMVALAVPCTVGTVRNFRDRRWSRMMGRAFALPAPPRRSRTSSR
jgi:hypothetical protein